LHAEAVCGRQRSAVNKLSFALERNALGKRAICSRMDAANKSRSRRTRAITAAPSIVLVASTPNSNARRTE
jgi:hypothetical protein